MTFTDSPDWQEVAVSVPSAGAMPDAPDWQRTVVGSGGVPIGGGGLTYATGGLAADQTYSSGQSPFIFNVPGLAAGTWLCTVVLTVLSASLSNEPQFFFVLASPATALGGSGTLLWTPTLVSTKQQVVAVEMITSTGTWDGGYGATNISANTTVSGGKDAYGNYLSGYAYVKVA